MIYIHIHKRHKPLFCWFIKRIPSFPKKSIFFPLFHLPSHPHIHAQAISHLPKNEVVPDDVLHSLVAPDVTVEALAGKILHVLDVYHEPLVLHLTTLLGLQAEGKAWLDQAEGPDTSDGSNDQRWLLPLPDLPPNPFTARRMDRASEKAPTKQKAGLKDLLYMSLVELQNHIDEQSCWISTSQAQGGKSNSERGHTW